MIKMSMLVPIIIVVIIGVLALATGIPGLALKKENKAKVPLEITAAVFLGIGLLMILFMGGSRFVGVF